MKNAKIILLVLIGVLLTCNFGCGGGGGGIDVDGNSEPVSEAAARLAEKILSPDVDGSPMVFDYATAPEIFSDESAVDDPQGLHFVKYISSKDLNSDGEYITTLHLNRDSEYVIKYSHGGRTLNNSLLGVEIIAPDGEEMILDLASFSEDLEISNDIIPVSVDLTEEQITALLEESDGMTREDLQAEIALEEAGTEIFAAHYVSVDLEIFPEENPCIILYIFKAPLTGDYKFAVSELVLESTDLSVDKSPDVPFEFRIYNTAEAHSVSDGEEIELYPEEILDIQRILLSSATEFNENGLPIEFEESGQSEVETSVVPRNSIERFYMRARMGYYIDDLETQEEERERKNREEKLLKILRERERARLKAYQERLEAERARKYAETHVVVAPVINNVPYDDVFVEGAGFHAHSGLRAVTNIIDDSAFSKNVIKNFSMPAGNAMKLNENFNADIIATQEEHDRAQEVKAMSNFALLREALGYTQRQDYTRLGSDHTKVISVRYELIEQQPRTPNSSVFQIDEEEMTNFKQKKDYYKEFLNEYGDYFVAGYTYGNRYDAIVEIVVEPGKSYYSEGQNDVYDAALICDKAAKNVQDLLKSVKENAVAERDTGKSNDEAKKRIEKFSKELQNNFHYVTINVSHCTQTGQTGEQSFSLDGFTGSLASFIKAAKTTSRAQYSRLYVTLRRFREIAALKPYIPEGLDIQKSLYSNIRTLNETIFRTRCYYNALMAIPASHLKNGASTQVQWKNEFETELIMRMRGGLNRICSDEKLVAEYQAKFNTLYEKYKALAERYNFYRYFVLVQKNTSSASWSDSDDEKDRTWEGGFRAYNKSTLVQQDIKDGSSRRYHHKESCTGGSRGATFSGNFGNEYIIWYKTGHVDTNHCTGRDANGKTIGRNYFSWTYTGATSRRCEVFLELQTVKLDPALYPFAGLE